MRRLNRLRELIDSLVDALIIAVFNAAAWAVHRYNLREPW